MMLMMAEDGEDNGEKKKWGTWEELILGAAVLRLGIEDWDRVASLLQSKTHYPSLFTSEDCRAKYEDLQGRYSGCNAWFEELRKRRVAELKKALAESDTSIGSLESKIEFLKAEKMCSNVADCSSDRAESPLQCRKSDEISEFSGKDPTKDGLSAGSYTQETHSKWSLLYNIPVEVSEDKTEEEPLVLGKKASGNGECFPCTGRLAEIVRSEYGVMVTKKRGQRKRKFSNAKEMCFREKNLLCLDNMGHILQDMEKVKEGGDCGAIGVKTMGSSEESEVDELVEVFDSILENEQASIFQRKMDSQPLRCFLGLQKRARYKTVVRQHIDLEMISSKITSKTISTVRELFRDLLLLANNALVFYSKTTREYKCALVLRNLVSKKLQGHDKSLGKRPSFGHSQEHDVKLAAKPRSARHYNKGANNKLPASTVIVTALAMMKGVESANDSSVNRKDESSVSMGSSLVKAKRQKGRLASLKKEKASAGAVVSDANSPVKPRKRPRAASK